MVSFVLLNVQNALFLGFMLCDRGRLRCLLFQGKRATRPEHQVICILLAALKACALLGEQETGKTIHSDSIATGHSSNICVGTALLDMYAKCGSMKDAQDIFNCLEDHDVVSWNALILGYSANGQGKLALELFARMQLDGCVPDSRTFVAALLACSTVAADEKAVGHTLKVKSLQKAVALRTLAESSGLERNIFVTNSLIDLYMKCGSTEDAQNVFDAAGDRDVVSWTSLVQGYAENGRGKTAWQFFDAMQYSPDDQLNITQYGEEDGRASRVCEPDARTFVAALMACDSMVSEEEVNKVVCLEKVVAVHTSAVKVGCSSNIFVASTLIHLYARCGSMWDALRVFERMDIRNSVSWNALILGFALNGEPEAALEFFGRMEDSLLNARTFSAVLMACSSLAAKEEGKPVDGNLEKVLDIHHRASRACCDADLFVASRLVEAYAKCGDMTKAELVLARTPCSEASMWNALIVGYVENGEPELGLRAFSCMKLEGVAPDVQTFIGASLACTSLAADGKNLVRCMERGMAIHSHILSAGYISSDVFLSNTLIDMYCKCGSMYDARKVFDDMLGSSNAVSWNALIMGYAENGENDLALKLFESCLESHDFTPNSRTYVSVLAVCGNLTALMNGRILHADVLRHSLEHDVFVGSSLVDFYGKCGSMLMAKAVFDSVDHTPWNALITGYSRLGDTEPVFQTFQCILEEGAKAGSIAFLSILTACSRAGLVKEGMHVFRRMSSRYGVEPVIEHYHCVVDMLGRANRLEEAVAVIESMPWKPNARTWTTVLSACNKWGNLEVGKLAFDALAACGDGRDASRYVLMANTCTKTVKGTDLD